MEDKVKNELHLQKYFLQCPPFTSEIFVFFNGLYVNLSISCLNAEVSGGHCCENHQ